METAIVLLEKSFIQLDASLAYFYNIFDFRITVLESRNKTVCVGKFLNESLTSCAAILI